MSTIPTVSSDAFAKEHPATGGPETGGNPPDPRPPDAGQNSLEPPTPRLALVPPSAMNWRAAELNLIGGTLGHQMFGLIFGPSGSGKSLIALDVGVSLAGAQNDWCGRTLDHGFVVYAAPEGGHSVHLRFHAWMAFHGRTPDDSLPFRTVPEPIDLCTSRDDAQIVADHVRAAAKELGPCKLIEIDTVSRSMNGGNENAPDDMGKFVANCDFLRAVTGASVFAVHHSPHSASERPRGHGCLMNAADIRIVTTKIVDGTFAAEIIHIKDGEAGTQLLFKLETAVVGCNAEGNNVVGGLVVPAGLTTNRKPGRPINNGWTETQVRILQEIRKYCLLTKVWTFSFEDFAKLAVKRAAGR